MNFTELVAGLKSGKIKIDSKNHLHNDILPSLERYLEHKQDHLKELIEKGANYVYKHDKEKGPIGEERSKSIISMVQYDLFEPLDFGHYLLGFTGEFYCFNCGAHLNIVPIDENTITLIEWKVFHDKQEKSGLKYDYRITDSEIPTCSSKELCDSKKMVAEIQVPSGQLVFTNFFKKDEIYDKPKEIVSINAVQGRYELMQYLAGKNIGYGQMGNMSVTVFVKETGDEIIISNDYGYSEEKGEYEVTYDGFINCGNISLSVWRWMCGDVQILNKHKEKLPKNLKPNKSVEHDYKDYILTEVQKGTWVIEHYFDFMTDEDNNLVYSKLYLKK